MKKKVFLFFFIELFLKNCYCIFVCMSSTQRYINKNRVCYRYLYNEVICQQLYCRICPTIQWPNLGNLLHTVWVMPNETTKLQDIGNKKTANFWLHPPPPSCFIDIYGTLYFIHIYLWTVQKVVQNKQKLFQRTWPMRLKINSVSSHLSRSHSSHICYKPNIECNKVA